MAERNPPLWVQAGSHPAENDRLFVQSIIATEGISDLQSNELLVSFSSGLTMSVAQGGAYIDGTQNAYQGYYYVYNAGAKTVTHAAGDATNGRIDLIVARVYDSAYTVGASNTWALEIVQGTASATPAAPATPANSLVLAQVLVPAGANATTAPLSSSSITDKRYPAVQRGAVMSTSGIYPLSKTGSIVYRNSDAATEGIEVYNGSSWRPPWNLPWGEVGSATHTADVSITGTPTTVKTVGFIAVANRIYHITAHVSAQPNENDEGIQYLLKDGTTVLQTAYVVSRIAVYRDTVTMLYRGTFTAGSKTITLAAQNYYGNGGALVKASATEPVVVTVVDMGPSGAPT